MSKTIGFIGYKGHALRLINIMREVEGWSVDYIYHPSKSFSDLKCCLQTLKEIKITNRLEDLLSCDVIVIAAPNKTHFSFLSYLSESYQGYIFCEKPPVSNIQELDQLENFSNEFKDRIYFNFNLRTSWLRDQIEYIHRNHSIGKPVQISVMIGYGFAFKEAYRSSWRSGQDFSTFGVLETLGIHFLDLVGLIYGKPTRGICYAHKHSPYGMAMDTCDFSCRLDSQCVLTICCSYAIPYVNRLEVQYTDGRLVYDDGNLSVYGPRDTFSDTGAFITPGVLYQANKLGTEVYTESLERSCRYFLDQVRGLSVFSRDLFDQSLLSNRVCLSVESL